MLSVRVQQRGPHPGNCPHRWRLKEKKGSPSDNPEIISAGNRAHPWGLGEPREELGWPEPGAVADPAGMVLSPCGGDVVQLRWNLRGVGSGGDAEGLGLGEAGVDW